LVLAGCRVSPGARARREACVGARCRGTGAGGRRWRCARESGRVRVRGLEGYRHRRACVCAWRVAFCVLPCCCASLCQLALVLFCICIRVRDTREEGSQAACFTCRFKSAREGGRGIQVAACRTYT
jgi:hypothetical protein